MELHELTALEQGEAIRTGETSATDLVEHYLARIEAYGAAVGAFVTVTAEDARAQAREPRPPGPLAGVPTAIKDLTMTAGVRTTFGSLAYQDFVPPVDADVVRLLRQAGTISLGKTTTSEFGISCHAESRVAPPARNPWAPQYTAGGSSGGAAAAVAAGLVPVAHGNDGGGSVRIPASICGLVGYKPSRGAVSNGPLGFGGFGLPVQGALGRTVADCAALVETMAVPQAGEPYHSVVSGLLAAAQRPYAGRRLRIARFTAPMLAHTPVDPSCVAAVDAASRALDRHEIVDVSGLLDVELEQRFDTLWAVLTLQAPVAPGAPVEPLTRYLRDKGEASDIPSLFEDLAAIQGEVRRALRSLGTFDLMLCPTLAAPQARIGYFAGAPDPAEDFTRQKRFSPYCAAYNVTGQPAVSLPVGRTPDGLPVGAMLAAAVGADALLLSVAAAIEADAPWRRDTAVVQLP